MQYGYFKWDFLQCVWNLATFVTVANERSPTSWDVGGQKFSISACCEICCGNIVKNILNKLEVYFGFFNKILSPDIPIFSAQFFHFCAKCPASVFFHIFEKYGKSRKPMYLAQTFHFSAKCWASDSFQMCEKYEKRQFFQLDFFM